MNLYKVSEQYMKLKKNQNLTGKVKIFFFFFWNIDEIYLKEKSENE